MGCSIGSEGVDWVVVGVTPWFRVEVVFVVVLFFVIIMLYIYILYYYIL